MPLLDLSDSEHESEFVVPLPSSHLPADLSTLNLYGMQLKRPVHKLIVEEAISLGYDDRMDGRSRERAFGHIVKKNSGNDDRDSLVGAVGCVAQVLIQAQDGDETEETIRQKSDIGQDSPMVVLCRGSYRFVVREVLKTFPFPMAIVDEFEDNDDEEQDGGVMDVDGMYKSLSVSELISRTMQGTKTYLDQRMREQEKEKSPLEIAILEDSGLSASTKEQSQLEETVAVFDVFATSLIDICSTPSEFNYAIAMMAAEVINVDNDLRKQLVATRNGVARLQRVCQSVEERVDMNQARNVADQITDKLRDQDSDARDLKVGPPSLPPWAAQIQKGVRVEYYWNEELEWCPGTVVEDPLKILDELIITVRFDDGEEHRLPLNPDEKLRWRPAGPPQS